MALHWIHFVSVLELCDSSYSVWIHVSANRTGVHILLPNKYVLLPGAVCLWMGAHSVHSAHGDKKDLGCVTITNPFHPLNGQSFRLLKIRRIGGKRIYSLQTKNDIIAIPESWTVDKETMPYSDLYFSYETLHSLSLICSDFDTIINKWHLW